MFILMALYLWSITVFAEASPANPAKVDSLIQASADTSLGLDTRRDILKEAVKLDRTGRALHALARLRLEKGTTYSRQQARSLLTRALEREPENGDYVATFAELVWRTGPRPRPTRRRGRPSRWTRKRASALLGGTVRGLVVGDDILHER